MRVLRSPLYPGPSIKLPPVDALPLGARVLVERSDGDFFVLHDGAFIWARLLSPMAYPRGTLSPRPSVTWELLISGAGAPPTDSLLRPRPEQHGACGFSPRATATCRRAIWERRSMSRLTCQACVAAISVLERPCRGDARRSRTASRKWPPHGSRLANLWLKRFDASTAPAAAEYPGRAECLSSVAEGTPPPEPHGYRRAALRKDFRLQRVRDRSYLNSISLPGVGGPASSAPSAL